MSIALSTNMNLPIPGVGTEPGPNYAQDVNNSLTIIDGHDHSPGSGVPITPQGLDINSDLTLNNNNLTNARSLRLEASGSPLSNPDDIGCLYESGVDLYYNDGLGNQVRITQSGGVAGTPGSIANLVAPASASYVSGSKTFVWQSAANTPANMDQASIILRNLVASSKGLTLAPPNAMAADFTITLPSLPASQKILSLDASGNMAAVYGVDNSTLVIQSNNLKVADGGITETQLADDAVSTAKIQDGAVTRSKLEAVGQQISSVGSIVSSDSTFQDIPNNSVTITTTGRPVIIFMLGGTSDTAGGFLGVQNTNGTQDASALFRFMRDSTEVSRVALFNTGAVRLFVPPASFTFIDTPAAGTYVYKAQLARGPGTTTGDCSAEANATKIVAYEL